jgi:hypothetical protein
LEEGGGRGVESGKWKVGDPRLENQRIGDWRWWMQGGGSGVADGGEGRVAAGGIEAVLTGVEVAGLAAAAAGGAVIGGR